MRKVNRQISISFDLAQKLNERKDINVSAVCEDALWNVVKGSKQVLEKEVDGQSLSELLPGLRRKFFSETAVNDSAVKGRVVSFLCVKFGLSRAEALRLLEG